MDTNVQIFHFSDRLLAEIAMQHRLSKAQHGSVCHMKQSSENPDAPRWSLEPAAPDPHDAAAVQDRRHVPLSTGPASSHCLSFDQRRSD